jgi:acyl-CoA thioesterase-1
MPSMNMPAIHRKFKSASQAVKISVRLSWILSSLLLVSLATGCQHSNARQPAEKKEASAPASPTPDDLPQIVAFGDSLTAGYGLDTPAHSYPALLQKRLDEKGYHYRVVNAGVSGDTSADGARRIDWALKGNVRFLILELGANDMLRGQTMEPLKKNLGQIIERAQSRNVTVILAGMEAPPNYGPDYTRDFHHAFRDVAAQYHIKLIPFFLEGVGGIAELNQGDGLHPNLKGTELVVENVWKVLEPLLAQP